MHALASRLRPLVRTAWPGRSCVGVGVGVGVGVVVSLVCEGWGLFFPHFCFRVLVFIRVLLGSCVQGWRAPASAGFGSSTLTMSASRA